MKVCFDKYESYPVYSITKDDVSFYEADEFYKDYVIDIDEKLYFEYLSTKRKWDELQNKLKSVYNKNVID